MDQVYDKNPKNGVGITPLEIAFQLRHFAIYKLIVDNTTPLYRAVRGNHFEVCQVHAVSAYKKRLYKKRLDDGSIVKKHTLVDFYQAKKLVSYIHSQKLLR